MRRARALVARSLFDALKLVPSAITAAGCGGPLDTTRTCTRALITCGRACTPRTPLLELAINGAFVFIAVSYLEQSRASEATVLVVAHNIARTRARAGSTRLCALTPLAPRIYFAMLRAAARIAGTRVN